MTTEASDAPQDVDQKTLRRAIAASAIGNATEWYDYGVYAYTTGYMGVALFNNPDAYSIVLLGYAVSFLARPIGGMVWGPLGDRIGRKSVLAMTIIMMSTATACIGLIPSYDMIGPWGAGAILFALRLVQGFSTGGEYGGAATFMAEYAPDRRRGFFGSFLEFGTLVGFSAGGLAVVLMDFALTDAAMNSWGWRIPYFVALPLGAIGLYLRSRMEDTPVFNELEAQGEKAESAGVAFKELWAQYSVQILRLGGLVVALNVINYTLLSYMPTYLAGTIGLTDNMSLLVPIFGQLAMLVFIPLAGSISDRTGRKPHWYLSLIGMLVMAVPMYMLMGTSVLGAFIGFAVLGLLYIPQLATISATFPAMFPTAVRYAGLAIAYNLSTAIFGGTAPLINEEVVKQTGWDLFPAYYMMGACVIGLLALIGVPETTRCSVRGTEIPGTPEHHDEMAEQGIESPCPLEEEGEPARA